MKCVLSQKNVLLELDSELDSVTVRDVLVKLTVAELVEHSVHFPLLKERNAELHKKCNELEKEVEELLKLLKEKEKKELGKEVKEDKKSDKKLKK